MLLLLLLLFQTLKEMLDSVSEYVDKVVKGEEEPNSAVGMSYITTTTTTTKWGSMSKMLTLVLWYFDPSDVAGCRIADALSSVPRIRPELFDQIFNSNLQVS